MEKKKFKTNKMKKILLFLTLVICSLSFVWSSPSRKDKKEKEHVVLKGKIIFKVKNLNQIKFTLEDRLNGKFRLTLFEETKTDNSDFLREKASIVEIIFKKRIYSKLYSSFNEKDIIYFQMNFLNAEVKEKNYAEIVLLALKTIHEIEKNMDCSIYPE